MAAKRFFIWEYLSVFSLRRTMNEFFIWHPPKHKFYIWHLWNIKHSLNMAKGPMYVLKLPLFHVDYVECSCFLYTHPPNASHIPTWFNLTVSYITVPPKQGCGSGSEWIPHSAFNWVARSGSMWSNFTKKKFFFKTSNLSFKTFFHLLTHYKITYKQLKQFHMIKSR